jgi:hypothetical protein
MTGGLRQGKLTWRPTENRLHISTKVYVEPDHVSFDTACGKIMLSQYFNRNQPFCKSCREAEYRGGALREEKG